MHWLTGSVGQASAAELRLLLVALVVLLPLAVLLQRQLRALELGDDAAAGLGTRTELSRAGLLAHRGGAGRPGRRRRPARSSSSRWSPARSPTGCSARPPAASLAAALVGAALLLAADLVAVHLLPTPLPTGVVTGAVGAPYLLWLLATTNRQGAGG